MSVRVPSAGAAQHDARGAASRFVLDRAWLGAGGVVLAAVVVLWLSTGVGGLDIVLYLGYLAVAVALPGILLAALLDRRPLGLAHVCVGIPLGLVQSMLAFVALAALGLRGAAPWAPLVSAALVGATLARRRRAGVGPRGIASGWIWGGALPVAAIALVSVGLLASSWFPQHPLPSHIGSGATYYPDLVWHIGNVVSLKEYWPPRDLRATGQPLKYYIGDYVQAAQTSVATGVGPATILLRLDPVLQLVLIAVQLFWVGRVFGRRVRTGVLVAFLTLLVGDLSCLDAATGSGFANTFSADLYVSPTYQLGLVLFVPLLGVAAEWLRAGGRIRSGAAATIALLTLGVGLTKTMPLAILLAAGAALIALDALVRRRLSRSGLVLAGLAGLTYVALFPLTHRQGEQATITFHFLGTVSSTPVWRRLLNSPIDVIPHHPVVALLVLLGNAPALLIGTAALLVFRRGRLAAEERLVALVAAAGAGIVLLFTATGAGQFYFWHYGYVAFAILGALGVDALLATRSRLTRRLTLAAVALFAILGVGSIVLQSGPDARAVVARVVPGVPGPFHTDPPSTPDLTQPVLRGALWLRRHTPAKAVVAVNNQSNRYFYYSAFSERQILLEGYDFTPAFQLNPTPAARRELQRRLSLLSRIYGDGSAAAIRELHRSYGVDYLLVDERDGLPHHALPASVTRLVFSDRQLRIYAVAAVDSLGHAP